MPAHPVVYVSHPIQLPSTDELHDLTEQALPEIVARLTDPGAAEGSRC